MSSEERKLSKDGKYAIEIAPHANQWRVTVLEVTTGKTITEDVFPQRPTARKRAEDFKRLLDRKGDAESPEDHGLGRPEREER